MSIVNLPGCVIAKILLYNTEFYKYREIFWRYTTIKNILTNEINKCRENELNTLENQKDYLNYLSSEHLCVVQKAIKYGAKKYEYCLDSKNQFVVKLGLKHIKSVMYIIGSCSKKQLGIYYKYNPNYNFCEIFGLREKYVLRSLKYCGYSFIILQPNTSIGIKQFPILRLLKYYGIYAVCKVFKIMVRGLLNLNNTKYNEILPLIIFHANIVIQQLEPGFPLLLDLENLNNYMVTNKIKIIYLLISLGANNIKKCLNIQNYNIANYSSKMIAKLTK